MDPHVESLVVRGRDVSRSEDNKKTVGLADIVVLLLPMTSCLLLMPCSLRAAFST